MERMIIGVMATLAAIFGTHWGADLAWMWLVAGLGWFLFVNYVRREEREAVREERHPRPGHEWQTGIPTESGPYWIAGPGFVERREISSWLDHGSIIFRGVTHHMPAEGPPLPPVEVPNVSF